MTDPKGLIIIDVSVYQGTIDWKAVAASGVVGAYIRVAEGVTADPSYERNRAAASAAGLLVGGYQFCRARHPGSELARVFLGNVDMTSLPPVLDVETVDHQTELTLKTCISDWIDAVPGAMIYTGGPFWDDAVGEKIGDTKLWLAAFVEERDLYWPKVWSGWTFWQFTDHRVTAGVSNPCDASVFRGTLDELRALLVTSGRETA